MKEKFRRIDKNFLKNRVYAEKLNDLDKIKNDQTGEEYKNPFCPCKNRVYQGSFPRNVNRNRHSLIKILPADASLTEYELTSTTNCEYNNDLLDHNINSFANKERSHLIKLNNFRSCYVTLCPSSDIHDYETKSLNSINLDLDENQDKITNNNLKEQFSKEEDTSVTIEQQDKSIQNEKIWIYLRNNCEGLRTGTWPQL